MNNRTTRSLPYLEDASKWLEALTAWPYPILLDSSHAGRYSIISASPKARVQLDDTGVTVEDKHGTKQYGQSDFFSQLRTLLATYGDAHLSSPSFTGAMGYLGYDIQHQIESLPPSPAGTHSLPIAHIAIYSWAIVQDHENKTCWVEGYDIPEQFPSPTNSMPTACPSIERWQPTVSREDYAKAIEYIKTAINKGDVYQVNFTQEFYAHTQAQALDIYQAVAKVVPSSYSAFIPLGDSAIISISPERFISCDGSTVVSQPIKGTRRRHQDPESDRLIAEQLQNATKDRAENLMIVDLMRNDLARVAQAGSVKVTELFGLHSFKNVHHLISTVEAKLSHSADIIDLLQATLPGGSITGAPKVRAMQLINELEHSNRSAYCGSIVRIGFDGSLDSSICIRTLVKSNDRLSIWGGGGIVADSVTEEEQQESRDKIDIFIKALGGSIIER